AIQAGEVERARELAVLLQPLWDLFAAHGGSLRVGAAIAEHLGLVTGDCLPAPLKGLSTEDKRRVASVVDDLGLENVRIVRARVEDLVDEEMFTVVTARAVKAMATLVEWTH
ncbi:class I SAM-dependent methyltransferase, partial [Mycobacterium tuberculosis]|nr:class I SAM-dependent methyltransferase [Mycobacterium tuberculosis]